MIGDSWTDAEIVTLHRLWTAEAISLGQVGRTMKRSKNSINSKLIRMREAEGDVRWPSRGTPIKKPKRVVKLGRSHKRRITGSTLPPLASA